MLSSGLRKRNGACAAACCKRKQKAENFLIQCRGVLIGIGERGLVGRWEREMLQFAFKPAAAANLAQRTGLPTDNSIAMIGPSR